MHKIQISGPVLHADGTIRLSTLLINKGQITQILDFADTKADIYTKGVIASGWIDLQVNGGYGHDFTDEPASIAAVAGRLPETGVTGFLPTRITSTLKSYPSWLFAAEEASQYAKGARILGVHLEGPYFSPAKPGAHNQALLRPINLGELSAYANSPLVRLVTLAPELPNAHAAIVALRRKNIIVSAGHSNATYAEAQAGFKAGITWGTHLFNAMRDFKQREPGLPGALLTSSIPCGLIADGIHVHPAALKLAWLAKGTQGITLVTDCMAAMGMSTGEYTLGTGHVLVDKTSARLADGTLAGSIATMDQCVRRMVEFTGCSLADALTMASRTPADLLGLTNKGRIAPGCDADLVVLDESLHVQQTLVAGEVIYER